MGAAVVPHSPQAGGTGRAGRIPAHPDRLPVGLMMLSPFPRLSLSRIS
jgi:hypothetical protein